MNQLYTPKEVAQLFKLSYRRILDMIALGEIGAYKIGGVFRIPESEIRCYLASVKVESFWNINETSCNT